MMAPISEIFYSLQMEGNYIGLAAIFIRFTGCNLNCDFCDTKYALKGGNMMTENEIYNYIKHFDVKRIIFTGGEPAIQDSFMSYFMDKHREYTFFLETNGTIFIEKSIKKFFHIVVSPKFFAIKENILKNYKKEARSVEFKFLADNKKDVIKTQELSDALNLYPITIQPIFDNNQPIEKYIKKTKILIETFKHTGLAKKDARLIIQNHKIIYKEQRGV